MGVDPPALAAMDGGAAARRRAWRSMLAATIAALFGAAVVVATRQPDGAAGMLSTCIGTIAYLPLAGMMQAVLFGDRMFLARETRQALGRERRVAILLGRRFADRAPIEAATRRIFGSLPARISSAVAIVAVIFFLVSRLPTPPAIIGIGLVTLAMAATTEIMLFAALIGLTGVLAAAGGGKSWPAYFATLFAAGIGITLVWFAERIQQRLRFSDAPEAGSLGMTDSRPYRALGLAFVVTSVAFIVFPKHNSTTSPKPLLKGEGRAGQRVAIAKEAIEPSSVAASHAVKPLALNNRAAAAGTSGGPGLNVPGEASPSSKGQALRPGPGPGGNDRADAPAGGGDADARGGSSFNDSQATGKGERGTEAAEHGRGHALGDGAIDGAARAAGAAQDQSGPGNSRPGKPSKDLGDGAAARATRASGVSEDEPGSGNARPGKLSKDAIAAKSEERRGPAPAGGVANEFSRRGPAAAGAASTDFALNGRGVGGQPARGSGSDAGDGAEREGQAGGGPSVTEVENDRQRVGGEAANGLSRAAPESGGKSASSDIVTGDGKSNAHRERRDSASEGRYDQGSKPESAGDTAGGPSNNSAGASRRAGREFDQSSASRNSIQGVGSESGGQGALDRRFNSGSGSGNMGRALEDRGVGASGGSDASATNGAEAQAGGDRHPLNGAAKPATAERLRSKTTVEGRSVATPAALKRDPVLTAPTPKPPMNKKLDWRPKAAWIFPVLVLGGVALIAFGLKRGKKGGRRQDSDEPEIPAPPTRSERREALRCFEHEWRELSEGLKSDDVASRSKAVVALFNAYLHLCARSGWPKERAETADEFASRHVIERPRRGHDARLVAHLYSAVFFGKKPIPADALDAYSKSVARLGDDFR